MLIRLITMCALVVIIDGRGEQKARNIEGLLTRPRPVSSGRALRPLPLPEEPNNYYSRPQSRDLHANKLTKKLGNAFDARWMSITDPTTDSATNEIEGQHQPGRRNNWLRRQLVALNITGDAARLELSSHEVASLEAWLMWRADCAVNYNWVHVGPLYWPPWVRHGSCLKKRCSWPDGMTCVPGDSTNIRLLRWHCRSRPGMAITDETIAMKTSGGASRGKQCKWLKVPYPITTQCVCSCS